MKILAIETSCDETAISLLEANSGFENPKFKVLSNALNSQIELHKEYGGVYPSLAKREHTKNLTPLLLKVMEEVFGNTKLETLNDRREPENHSNVLKKIRMVLEREPELFEQFARIVLDIKKPDIDYIAVTEGPGLEPALWVGINFAKALSLLWNIPLIPINHMEGHILSPLLNKENKITFPSLALLISGGHTELVLMKDCTNTRLLERPKTMLWAKLLIRRPECLASPTLADQKFQNSQKKLAMVIMSTSTLYQNQCSKTILATFLSLV